MTVAIIGPCLDSPPRQSAWTGPSCVRRPVPPAAQCSAELTPLPALTAAPPPATAVPEPALTASRLPWCPTVALAAEAPSLLLLASVPPPRWLRSSRSRGCATGYCPDGGIVPAASAAAAEEEDAKSWVCACGLWRSSDGAGARGQAFPGPVLELATSVGEKGITSKVRPIRGKAR